MKRKPAWTWTNSKAAQAAGWDIFHSDSEQRPGLQLQRLDEAETFKDDGDAWAFVWAQAEAGDRLAKKALAIILDANPSEYAAIKEFGIARTAITECLLGPFGRT